MTDSLAKLLAAQQQSSVSLMAQVLLARADVDATVALVSSVLERMPPDNRPSFVATEEFRRLRRQRIESLLLSLEDLNPELAAEIQRIVDS